MTTQGPHLVFATSNPFKIQEAKIAARAYGLNLVGYNLKIHEIQTDDPEVLVHDKALAAFAELRLPVMVDHASLRMDCLAGMPGTLTQLFWDRLGGSGLCEISTLKSNNAAQAGSTVGYCDSYRIHIFSEFQDGNIVATPRGTRRFQWDTIFQPEGHSQTYAQMTIAQKNSVSQRGRALAALFRHAALRLA